MSIKQLKENVSDDDLANAKVSLRVDPDDNFDDDLIKMLIKASRRDIIEQVGEQIDDYFDGNAIFDAAVLIEVGHLYNHRDSTSAQQEYEVPMALYSLINAMKDDYRYLMFRRLQKITLLVPQMPKNKEKMILTNKRPIPALESKKVVNKDDKRH